MSGEIMETRMRATLVVAVLVVVYPGVAFAQLAPQSQAEFEQRFTGWTVQSDAPDCNEGDGIDPITFIEPGRFDVNGFFGGNYEYKRTGANTGTLTVTLDFFPIPQVLDLTFNSQTMGTFTVAVFGVACEGSFEFVESTPGKPQTGEQIYYFPHLAVGASWQTTITYINYSPEEVTCQTDFISDHGTPLMVSFTGLGTVDSRTDVLPPGGSVHQETNVDLNASLAPGWARATCSGPVKASLLYRLHNSEGAPTAEAGVNAATVPATRFVTFAEQGEGQFGTGVAYATPSAISVPVTFTARDGVGDVLASVVRTLSPGGHDAHGMAELFGLTSFTGSLEVTSTEPIVSLSLNFEAAPVFSSLPPGDIPGVSDTPPPTPSLLRTTFGSGIWLVNEEIAPGRYFTNPASGCYWERLSDTGGSLSDILANEFISFDSGQEIVDIASSDYAFKPDSKCGTWSQTLVAAPSCGIPPGRWLVGRQIPTDEYETNASRGCYWERLSGFSGRDIIANDFVGDAGRQIVRISSSDEG